MDERTWSNLFGWIGLILSTAALLAQVPVTTPGKVELTVLDSLSNQPVTGARVELQQIGRGASPGVVHATSNEYGKVSFPRVEPGQYRIALVQAEGYIYEQSSFSAGAPINVVEGAVAHAGNVTVVPLGTVQGTVTDEEGKALAGATVTVLRYTYANGLKTLIPPAQVTTATTDARGRYKIEAVPPGRYYVRLSRPHLPKIALPVFAPIYYPDGETPEQATRIEVSSLSGMAVADFRIRSTNTFHLRGRVFGIPEKTRMRMVTIQSCTQGVREPPAFINALDIRADGLFDAAGLPPGRYCLSFAARNGAETLSEANDVFTVSDRDVDDIRLAAEPLVDISGRIVREDGLSVSWPDSIRLVPAILTGTPPISGKVSAGGTFQLFSVRPEAYKLQVLSMPVGGYLKSIKFGDREVIDGNIKPSGGGTLVIEIGAARCHLSGTVDFGSKAPTEGIPVTLAPAGSLSNRADLIRTVYTNSKGEFAANGLMPGAYRIFPWQELERELVQLPEFLSQFVATSVDVTEEGSANVEVKMISSAEIEAARTRF